MIVRHPASFGVASLASLVTAALSVSFVSIHWIGLAVDVTMIWVLRSLCHWEAKY